MRTLSQATNGVPLEYGDELPDGTREVIAQIDGVYRVIGRLQPGINQATAEASPGIQSWSHPRAKGGPDVRLDNPNSVADFAKHWERHWRRSYPLDGGRND